MITDYLKYLQQKGESPHTIISYMNDLYKFFHDLGIHPGDVITKTDIRKWISHDPSRGRSTFANSNINRRLNALRNFYDWAERNKKVQNNPMNDIEDLKLAGNDYEKIL